MIKATLNKATLYKSTLGAAVIAVVGAGATAQAADLSYRPAPQPYTVYQPLNALSWAGPYLGANVSYTWGQVDNNPTRPAGFGGGIQGGYNWQSGQFVFGLEGDISASAASDNFAPWKFSNPWFGTARGRLGYAVNSLLIYGTGGLAFGELRGEAFGVSESHTNFGWTLGGGAELALNQNWSAKAEFLYVNLSDDNFNLTRLQNGVNFSTIRLGVNYHF